MININIGSIIQYNGNEILILIISILIIYRCYIIFYYYPRILFNKDALIITTIIFILISGGFIMHQSHQNNIRINRYERNDVVYTDLFYMMANKKLEQSLPDNTAKDVMQTADSPFYTDIKHFHSGDKRIHLFKYDLFYRHITEKMFNSLRYSRHINYKFLNHAKNLKKKDIFNSCCIDIYFIFFIPLLLLSFIYYKDQKYQILTLINKKYNRKGYSLNDVCEYLKYFKRYVKHKIINYIIKEIVDEYMFYIIPIMISISSGIVTFLTSNNTFYYLAEFSVPIFSVIQFLRIYDNYIYHIRRISSKFSKVRKLCDKDIKKNLN